jgi:ribonucleoside-triphosphate reductase
MVQITKRDGRLVPFDKDKIERAVLKAFVAVDGELTDYAISKAQRIADYVESISEEKVLGIEEIQDYVENGLMSTKRHDVARAYITYREERTRKRKTNSELIKMVREKLQSLNVENQNANLDEYSFGGRIGEAASVVMKDIALNEIMSDKARTNHLKNRIYTHDLSHYAVGDHNCLTIPFDKLLASGFNTRQTDVRPANSVRTAFQLIAVLFQIQSLQQFGGVSASHLDWSMVPYVRKSFTKHLANGLKYIEKVSEYKAVRFDKWLKHDPNHPDGTIHLDDEEFKKLHPAAWEYAMDMLKEELKQSAEGMYHNLNTLQSRSGNQLPFTSINYGTCTLLEGQLVTEALLDALIAGVGKYHRTSIFPCGIFQFMKDVNDKKGTPNYYLFRKALQATAKRLYPNYANVNWSGNAGFDINDPSTYFSTMGCRTANGWDINGFGQLKDGRGNICPVTIIMPTLAMEAKERADRGEGDIVDIFLEILAEAISDAKDILIERFEWICAQPMEAAKFMYENGTMAGYIPEEGIRSALKHGTLAIGQLGLAETLEILVGCNHTKPRGMKVAIQIESMFKEICAKYKEEYKLNFGVYYTPKFLWGA